MATVPTISISSRSLDLLFDEQRGQLPPVSYYEDDQHEEALKKEQEAIRRRRAELATELARLDDDIDAAEQLLDEALLGPFVARQLARERAAQKARME